MVDALLSIEGTRLLSEYPRKHTLTRVDTTGFFDTVAETHKKRGYYLSSALEEKGITGVIPGATKVWKFNSVRHDPHAGRVSRGCLHQISAQENGLAAGK